LKNRTVIASKAKHHEVEVGMVSFTADQPIPCFTVNNLDSLVKLQVRRTSVCFAVLRRFTPRNDKGFLLKGTVSIAETVPFSVIIPDPQVFDADPMAD
jgi:hypothetical protein